MSREKNVENWKVKQSWTISKENVEFLNNLSDTLSISVSSLVNGMISAFRKLFIENKSLLLSSSELDKITQSVANVVIEEIKGVKSSGQ
jgi:hypothetical protein